MIYEIRRCEICCVLRTQYEQVLQTGKMIIIEICLVYYAMTKEVLGKVKRLILSVVLMMIKNGCAFEES